MKRGQRKYVPFKVAAERVTTQLKDMKEKYNRMVVERGIEDYMESIRPEVEADIKAMEYALARGFKRSVEE